MQHLRRHTLTGFGLYPVNRAGHRRPLQPVIRLGGPMFTRRSFGQGLIKGRQWVSSGDPGTAMPARPTLGATQ